MKVQWLLATAAIAVSTISAVSADSAAFQKKVQAMEGLLGNWAFEDNLADSTKNANDGKVKGEAAMVTFGPGVNGGRALKIDNSTPGQMVEVNTPIGSIFDTPKTTVATWAIVTNAEEGLWNSIIDRNSLWGPQHLRTCSPTGQGILTSWCGSTIRRTRRAAVTGSGKRTPMFG